MWPPLDDRSDMSPRSATCTTSSFVRTLRLFLIAVLPSPPSTPLLLHSSAPPLLCSSTPPLHHPAPHTQAQQSLRGDMSFASGGGGSGFLDAAKKKVGATAAEMKAQAKEISDDFKTKKVAMGKAFDEKSKALKQAGADMGAKFTKQAGAAAAWSVSMAKHAGGKMLKIGGKTLQMVVKGSTWIKTKALKHRVLLIKLAVGAALCTVSIAFPPAGAAAVALGVGGVAWNIGWSISDAIKSRKECQKGAVGFAPTKCKVNKCKMAWMVTRQIVVNGVTLACGIPMDAGGDSAVALATEIATATLGDAANYVGLADATDGSLNDFADAGDGGCLKTEADGTQTPTPKTDALCKKWVDFREGFAQKVKDSPLKIFKCSSDELFVPVDKCGDGATEIAVAAVDVTDGPGDTGIDRTVDLGSCTKDTDMSDATDNDGTKDDLDGEKCIKDAS